MTHTESHPPQIFYHKKKKRWLTTTIFLSVTCYNVTILITNYYTDFFELGQQKINFSFYELSLPDDDPVYTLKKVMEDLDFSGLLANCSDKGRTGYNPIMMYAVCSLKGTYTTEQLLHTLKDIKFTDIEEQGFMPVYERQEITDDLHETCGFRTDYQFITKRKMKGIQKKSKQR